MANYISLSYIERITGSIGDCWNRDLQYFWYLNKSIDHSLHVYVSVSSKMGRSIIYSGQVISLYCKIMHPLNKLFWKKKNTFLFIFYAEQQSSIVLLILALSLNLCLCLKSRPKMVDHVKNFGRKFEKMMEDIQKDLLFSQTNIQNLAFVKSFNAMFLS